MSNRTDQIKALSSELRMSVLQTLDNPLKHYSHQQSAPPGKLGVSMNLIADKFELSQPTMSRHLELLKRAGFITTTKRQNWIYCKKNDAALIDYCNWLRRSLNIPAG